jgi:hypothetical protein
MLARPLGATLIALSAAAAAQPAAGLFEPVAWIAGCWAAEGREPGSGEHWMAPAGGTMLGMSRTVRGGRTIEFEFIQLRAGPDGRLAYIALPSGQRETTFTLKSAGADEVVFENPQHDFPQRVIYRRRGERELVARIEGRRGGTGPERGIDFPMRRTPCETP